MRSLRLSGIWKKDTLESGYLTLYWNAPWLIHCNTFIAPSPTLTSHPSLAVRPWRVSQVRISFHCQVHLSCQVWIPPHKTIPAWQECLLTCCPASNPSSTLAAPRIDTPAVAGSPPPRLRPSRGHRILRQRLNRLRRPCLQPLPYHASSRRYGHEARSCARACRSFTPPSGDATHTRRIARDGGALPLPRVVATAFSTEGTFKPKAVD